MAEELAGLALVPAGIGPRAVLLEAASEPLGAPFIVTSYVPGAEVQAADWTDQLLAAHARQLAAVHARPYGRCGDVTAADADRSSVFSLSRKYAGSISWWRATNPEVVADPEVAALAPMVEAYLASAEPAFSRLRRFALVHGDCVLPNVLVDDAGVPRYVDWEWVEIGDPAQDLAYIGGPVAAPPWYLSLQPDQVESLLDAYVAVAGDAAGEPADLRHRRNAFEVYERFLSSLHFRVLRDGEEDRQSGKYTHAVQLLTEGLKARLH